MTIGPPTDSRSEENPRVDVSRWFDDHADALYRYARLRVRRRETAEDLVQETFLAALSTIERYSGQSSQRTWLVSILRHKLVDYYRSQAFKKSSEGNGDEPWSGRAKTLLFTDLGHWSAPPGPSIESRDRLEEREFWQILEHCLRLLPEPLSSAFVLRELEAMELEEARRTLGVTNGNLRVRLHRARLLIRHCLERHGLGEEFDPARRV
jgi:RNA polymerase sigma-70 factor (ECF subfamily)